MKKIQYINKKSGVTLIALVITIIVLLILAGISIAVLTGENGIIEKANDSKYATELGQIKEEVIQKWYELERETVDEYLSDEEMASKFEQKLKNTVTAEEANDISVRYNSDNETFEVIYKGHELEIQANGKVTNNREVAKKNVKDAWDKIKDDTSLSDEAKIEKLKNALQMSEDKQITIDSNGDIKINDYNGYSETIKIGDNGETTVEIEDTTYKDRASVTINKEPEDLGLFVGSTATFTVDATATGDILYQWYETDRNSNIGGTPISGANASTLTIQNVNTNNDKYYYCEITSKYQGRTAKEKTQAVKLTVVRRIDKPTVSASQVTVEEGNSLNIGVTVEGDGTITYQWYYTETNSNQGGTAIEGANQSTFNKENVTTQDTGYYYCVVTQDVGDEIHTVTCDPIKVDIKIPVQINTQPIQTGAIAEQSAEIKAETRGNGKITYQWYKTDTENNTDETTPVGEPQVYEWYKEGVADGPQDGKTSSIFKIDQTQLTDDAYYFCKIRQEFAPDGTDVTIKTDPVKITVVGKLELTATPKAENRLEGNPVTFAVETSGGGDITFQWYKNSTNSTEGGTLIEGATNASYTISSTNAGNDAEAGDNGYYYCIVHQSYNGQTNEITTEPAQLIVEKNISITTQPIAETNVIEGKADVTFSIETRGEGTITYQWYYAENEQAEGVAITEANSRTYTIPQEEVTTNKTGYYYVTAIQEYYEQQTTITSQKAHLSVAKLLSITAEPQDVTVLETHEATLNVVIDASEGPQITYQWYKNEENNTEGGQAIDGANQSTFNIARASLENNGYYYCVITQKYGETEDVKRTRATQIEVLEVTIAPAEPSIVAYVNGSNHEVSISGDNMGGLSITDGTNETVKEDAVARITLDQSSNVVTIEPKATGNTSVTIKESNAEKTTTINIEVKGTTIEANGENPLSVTTNVGADASTVTLTGENAGAFIIDTEPDSSYATASILGNTLTITPVWAGETSLVVKESNGNQTVTINVTVNKGTPTIILSETANNINFEETKTFTVKPTSQKPESVPEKNVSGTWQVTSSNPDNVEIQTGNNETATDNEATTITYYGKAATTEATTITVTFTPEDTTNYEIVNAIFTVNEVNKIQAVAPVLADTTNTYDGLPHTVETTSAGHGGTLKYRASTDGGLNYGEWKTAEEWTNGSPSITNTTDAESGTLYVQAYIQGDTNHTDSSVATATAHVGIATMTATGTDYNGTYDGQAHSIQVTVTKPTNGTVIYYSKTALTETNYQEGSTTLLTRTIVGTETIYWCVVDTNQNYATLTGHNDIIITEKSIDNADINVTLSKDSYTYDGNEKIPDVTVRDGETELIEKIDYTLSYNNNATNNDNRREAGTITVIVTGKGNYTGNNSSQIYNILAKVTWVTGTNEQIEGVTRVYDSEIGILPTATKTGYNLDGWYTEQTGGIKIDETTKIRASEVTYYAHWKDDIKPTVSETTASTTWDLRNYVDFTAGDEGTGINGYNITTNTTEPTTWIPVINAVEAHTETKYESDAAWARVFHHNNHWGSVLFSDANTWAEAKSTDTVDKYSVLGKLENYKNSSGEWELLLQYPTLSTSQYNRWKQTGNPASTTVANGTGSENAPGYTGVNISWTDNYWGGLTLSTSGSTFINGSVGHGNWFYAIGSKDAWSGGIPGPASSIGVANVWTRVDDKATVAKNSLTQRIGELTSNTTYYVWVKDASGNTNYKSVVTNRVDTTGPTITASDITYGANLSITLADSQSNVVAWQVVNNDTGPSGTWTNITATASTTVTKSELTAGTWYIYAKDAAGNLSKKSISVARAKTATASAANKTYSGSAQTGVTGNFVTWSGTTSATNAGTYKPKATPDANHAWSDGGTGAKEISWTMAQKTITVTAAGKSKTYGAANPALTYSHSGVVSGQTAKFTGALSTSATTTSNVGKYDITQGTLALADNSPFLKANYKISYTKAILTINKANQSWTMTSSMSIVAGNTGTISISGTGQGTRSSSSNATGKATVSGLTVTGVAAGSATITVTYNGGTNYNSRSQTCAVTVTAKNYQISSGSPTYHTTLANAISKCNANGTITALAGTSEGGSVTINKNLTINTNGKTLTRTSGTINVTAGTTTISGNGAIDSTADGTSAIAVSAGTIKTSGSPLIQAKGDCIHRIR